MRDSVKEADLREICTLPAQFPSSGLSWIDLVRQSPFPSNQDHLDEGHLVEFLRSNPELIELWLGRSADKRCTPSQFFRESGSRYELGYVTTDGTTPDRRPHVAFDGVDGRAHDRLGRAHPLV